MAGRQAIIAGFPFPVYINETGTRQAIVAGPVYINETQATKIRSFGTIVGICVTLALLSPTLLQSLLGGIRKC